MRCQGVWHAECYRQKDDDKFPVLGVSDLDNALINKEVLEEDDPNRFKVAHTGDHMMVPFQCDECLFHKLQGRPPGEGFARDTLLMKTIWRAILDSFWSRESSTVRNNFYESKRLAKIQAQLGLSWATCLQTGPFSALEDWGVDVAVAILIRSLDPGKNARCVQFDTIRKLRSFVSNYTHAGSNGTGATFMSDDRTAACITNSPKNSLWFNRFMQGCHRRMGDTWLPDKAVSWYVMGGAFQVLEESWTDSFGDAHN